MTKLCGKPMSKAKNDKNRGFCKRGVKHKGKCGNETCYFCSARLTTTRGLCGTCRQKYNQIPKIKSRRQKYQQKYNRTTKRKNSLKKYRQSQRGRQYRKNWLRTPKGKLSRKTWRKSRKGKINRQRFSRSPKGKTIKRHSASRIGLLEALKTKTSLINGWPDAGLIEQKIGADRVRQDQWRRAARLLSHGIALRLLFASSHESAVFDKHKTITFSDYAKQLGMTKEWKKLLMKERKIMEIKKEYTRCDKCGTHNPCGDECRECGADLKVKQEKAT